MESKYKIGDKVIVKSIGWYNDNKDYYGSVDIGDKKPKFTYAMSKYCGQVLTVDDISEYEGEYYMVEDDGVHFWADEMFEGVVDANKLTVYGVLDSPMVDDYIHRLKDNEFQIALPEGYQFVDRQGNIIDTSIIMVKKKGVEYPKTFLGCCDVLGIEDTISRGVKGYKSNLLDTFQKLLICRDAYWMVYGEENGLGKPWENGRCEVVYSICRDYDNIVKQDDYWGGAHIFEFPIREMRDAFFNAFRDDIELCKELI